MISAQTNSKKRKTLRRLVRLRADKILNLAPSEAQTSQKCFLSFDSISIYDDSSAGEALIKNLNFSVVQNEKIAIIGDINTPLSAIFDLLLQFNVEYKGDVYLQNQAMRFLELKSVREQIFFLDKSVPIFNDSVKRNISPVVFNKPIKKTDKKLIDLVDRIFTMFKFDDKEFVQNAMLRVGTDSSLISPYPNIQRANKKEFNKIIKTTKASENLERCEKKKKLLLTRNLKAKEILKLKVDHKKISSRERTSIGMARVFTDKKSLCLLDRIDARFQNFDDLLNFSELMESEMTNSTVMMVCEKASTAEYFDRVLVFENGELIEDGKPGELKDKEGSLFGRMLEREYEVE